MGNLEKAGVLVVVVLLAIILGVAFHNDGDAGGKQLSAYQGAGKDASRTAQTDLPQDPRPSPAPQGGRSGDGEAPAEIHPGGSSRTPANQPDEGRDPAEAPPKDPGTGGARFVDPPKPQEPHKGGGDVKSDPLVDDPATVAPEWPKTVKVEKSDGSLLAVVRRVYGAKDAQAMLPAVMKENPGLKPTALKVGQSLKMPAKATKSTDAAKEPEKKATPGTKSAPPKDAKTGTKKPVVKSAASKPGATKPAAAKSAAGKDGAKKRLAFQPAR